MCLSSWMKLSFVMSSIVSILPDSQFDSQKNLNPQPRLTARRILIVEDEDLIRETVALALRQAGYQVLLAVDGRQALELLYECEQGSLETAHIHLVILDLMLPDINGLDICRHIRGRGSHMPILMLSARSSEIDRVIGLEVGADDYLSKPFGMQELITRCSVLLRCHPTAQVKVVEPVLQVREIMMYLDSHRVMVRGKEVALTPKEFSLLELFMSHPRRIWSREQLLEQVWGEDYSKTNRTVEVHIRWLREKIEIDPKYPKYLVTEWGIGYRFG